MGIDFGNLSFDTPIENVKTEGIRSTYEWLQQSTQGRTPTVKDLAILRSKRTRIVGTPETIADRLELWREAGVGVDGINVVNATIPGSYEEFIDQVMPVLRKRGLVRSLKDESETLRHKLFGTDRLSDRHPAARYRGAFADKGIVKHT